MIQIAWLIYDDNKNLIGKNDFYIKPDGFEYCKTSVIFNAPFFFN